MKWLRWLWHKPEPIIKYVLVSLPGECKSYEDRWKDAEYLEAVSALSNNQVLNLELTRMLKTMRDYADNVVNNEERKGAIFGCNLIKNFMLIGNTARNVLSTINKKPDRKTEYSGEESG